MASHNITDIRRTLPRNGWKIVHYSRVLGGQKITASHTVGLPEILPHIRENIYICGLEKDLAEEILDCLVSFILQKKKIIEPGDTMKYKIWKFLVLRESIPPSICTQERSILILHPLEPTERQL